MPKITFIGAGSTIFARNLLGDILSFPDLAGSTISLFDIDQERLRTSEIVAHKVADTLQAQPTIEATTDRRAALDGADYAICMIQVGGYKPATVVDFEIPKKYGLRQTIADTLGIGGIMRGLRTIPVLLDMCHEMEELCPNVTFLNYVNPMAMNCWAIHRVSKIKTVGLCHSVQGTADELAYDIGLPFDEINYICAGINHMAFYLRFERDGQDLYPLLRRVVKEGRVPDWAFIERGMDPRTIPLDDPRRREEGMLGTTAIYLEEDIAVHGTNSPELLGQSVSHGCIRMTNEAVRRLYHEVEVGTPVIIY
jgi:alpha-galactosidase